MSKVYTGPLFIDSGAHGLYNEFVIHAKQATFDKYAWYRTKEFTQYLDKYAQFIKQNEEHLTVYANVDAIFNPELTWEAQEYLENEHGIIPIPVIHFNTELKWLEKYLAKNYEYIALGGLGQEANQSSYTRWADQAFDMICGQASRLPVTKVHGFAMTSHRLMMRYPWYSVDSTSWLKFASYGIIIYPGRKNGEWQYHTAFHTMKVSGRASDTKLHNIHSYHKVRNQVALDYIAERGYKLGKSSYKEVKEGYLLQEGELKGGKLPNGKHLIEVIEERGLCNDSDMRCSINAEYFLDFAKHLPQWPWPFPKRQTKTLFS